MIETYDWLITDIDFDNEDYQDPWVTCRVERKSTGEKSRVKAAFRTVRCAGPRDIDIQTWLFCEFEGTDWEEADGFEIVEEHLHRILTEHLKILEAR